MLGSRIESVHGTNSVPSDYYKASFGDNVGEGGHSGVASDVCGLERSLAEFAMLLPYPLPTPS